MLIRWPRYFTPLVMRCTASQQNCVKELSSWLERTSDTREATCEDLSQFLSMSSRTDLLANAGWSIMNLSGSPLVAAIC